MDKKQALKNIIQFLTTNKNNYKWYSISEISKTLNIPIEIIKQAIISDCNDYLKSNDILDNNGYGEFRIK